MNHNITVTNGNVRLRPLSKNDIELLRVWRNDNDNSKFLSPVPHITPERQQAWFGDYLADSDTYSWAIDEILELDRCVGSVSLYHFTKDLSAFGNHEYDLSIKNEEAKAKGLACEFGRLMIGDTEARGKKIGLSATKLCVDIAFKILDVEILYLSVDKENIPAYKIYREAGFA